MEYLSVSKEDVLMTESGERVLKIQCHIKGSVRSLCERKVNALEASAGIMSCRVCGGDFTSKSREPRACVMLSSIRLSIRACVDRVVSVRHGHLLLTVCDTLGHVLDMLGHSVLASGIIRKANKALNVVFKNFLVYHSTR